jgi:hypothetical protein
MVLLGDVAQLEARIGPFGDSANLDARYVHVLRWMYHKLGNHFGCTRWNNKVTWVMWNHVSVHLETLLVSVQDTYTVCAKHTIGIEIVLDAPNRCSVCTKRIVGLEIILQKLDGPSSLRGSTGSSF